MTARSLTDHYRPFTLRWQFEFGDAGWKTKKKKKKKKKEEESVVAGAVALRTQILTNGGSYLLLAQENERELES